MGRALERREELEVAMGVAYRPRPNQTFALAFAFITLFIPALLDLTLEKFRGMSWHNFGFHKIVREKCKKKRKKKCI